MHFLPPPGVNLVTSEGLSRVEVELNNDNEDPDGLSKLACIQLGLADVKDAFRRFKISKLYSSLFALPEVRGEEVGAPLVGRVCPCFSSLPLGHAWSLFFLSEMRLKRRCGPLQTLRKQKLSRRFFNVYVDNSGVLRTSRENVDNDLMMAIQTLKSRGLDAHEETVHSDIAIALGIHIDLRNMLVSVAPTHLWLLEQGLRWALRCRALPGKTWEVLLGHMTFVSLLRRDVLSVEFALNKFIRANYQTSARLWPSARAEVQAFVGLLPPIRCYLVHMHCRDRCKRVWLWCLSEGVRKSRLSDHRTDQ